MRNNHVNFNILLSTLTILVVLTTVIPIVRNTDNSTTVVNIEHATSDDALNNIKPGTTSKGDMNPFSSLLLKHHIHRSAVGQSNGFKEYSGQFSEDIFFSFVGNKKRLYFGKSHLMVFYQGENDQFETFNISFPESTNTKPLGKDILESNSNNYYTGGEFISTNFFNEIWYENIYDGIDLKYYFTSQGLKYDFILKPNADPNQILIEITSNMELTITSDQIRMYNPTTSFEMVDTGLVGFQGAETVDIKYVKSTRENTYRFEIEDYNKDKELIIDPLLLDYGTYFGGSGSDLGMDLYATSDDLVYFVGQTNSVDIPTYNAINDTYSQNFDLIIGKLNLTSNELLFSTYYGGKGDDLAEKIYVDDLGNIYILGHTTSQDFPLISSYNAVKAGSYDIFVLKLNSTGNGVIFSTMLGGSSTDKAYDFLIDDSEDIYILGETSSSDYPTLDAYQSSFKGRIDVLLTKLNSSGNGLEFSTYFGGANSDSGRGIDVDGEGNILITGYTESTYFNWKNPYQFDDPDGMGWDAFFAKFNSTGNGMIFGSYLGGTGSWEIGESIEVNNDGSFVIFGVTDSTDFPVKNAYDSTSNGDRDLFVSKINSTGTGLEFSTYMGGSSREYAEHMITDDIGNIYFVGSTASSDYPTVNSDQDSYNGGFDGYLTGMNRTGQQLMYSSFVGGSDNDEISSISLSNYKPFVIGKAASANLILKDPYMTDPDDSNNDVFIHKFSFDSSSPNILLSPGNTTYESGSNITVLQYEVIEDHPSFYNIIINDTIYSTNTPWVDSSISIDFPYTGLGVYKFTVEFIDEGGLKSTDTIFIEIEDTTNPEINGDSSITYELGSTSNYINWTVGDVNPDRFDIRVDGNSVYSDIWENGSLSYNIDGFSIGVHTLEIDIYDSSGNKITEIVAITVEDTTVPIVSSASDISYDMETTGNFINWELQDLDPDIYNVTVDGQLFQSATAWTNGTVSVNMDGFSVGEYSVTIFVYDVSGNKASDTVNLRVYETTSPIIDTPGDISYEMGTTGNFINWELQDLDPDIYNVTVDGQLFQSATAWTNGTVSVNLDGFPVGEYNVTIFVYDVSGNKASDTVNLRVYETTSPIIDTPGDISYEMGTTGNFISWTVGDAYPDIYNVTVDGQLFQSATAWTNGTVSVSLEELSLGQNNITIYVYDTSGNWNHDSVLISIIDTTSPTIDEPLDISYELGSSGNEINWTVFDYNPYRYNVTRDSKLHQSTSSWENGVITISIDNLNLGTYNFTIYVYDTSGNRMFDSVLVTVVDTISPSISSPNDITFEVDSSGKSIKWNVTDLKPGIYNITMNNEMLISDTDWTNGTISLDLDFLKVGEYTFTIYVYDSSGNVVTDTVMVTVFNSSTDTSSTTTQSDVSSPITTTSNKPTTQDPTLEESRPSLLFGFRLYATLITILVSLAIKRKKRDNIL